MNLTRKHKVLEALMSNDWVPAYIIQSVEVGGVAGLKRCRELRYEHGFDIEWRWKEGTQTTLYHLKTPHDWIDFEGLRVVKPKPEQLKLIRLNPEKNEERKKWIYLRRGNFQR